MSVPSLLSRFLQLGVERRSWLEAATSLAGTGRKRVVAHIHDVTCASFPLVPAGGEWGSLDLIRHRSHLGARSVQAVDGLQKGRLTPCCYVGCTEVRAKGQR
jgi:hypothetical protein